MGAPHLSPARERLGVVLKERWVLEDVLGVGGMAAVYRARHRNGARAAIKLLHRSLGDDPVVRERFLREAYLANSLEHPGTVHVLDDDADPKHGHFLVMELLEGSSILELLDRGIVIDVPATLDIADQALDVLASAHDKGIVHRDLKPANLFLCRDGRLKVLDFGIARVLDVDQSRLTRTGVPLGTPAYMAPEQARGAGREVDGRADVYALGATLFRILAGRHVHVGKGAEQIAQVATKRAPKLRTVAPAVPESVAAVIDRALEFEPARRFATALEMQEDVRALSRGDAPTHALRPLPSAGSVPPTPALLPRPQADEEDSGKDAQAVLAESLRKRAHEIARRPDAFKEGDVLTMVGEPAEMSIGLQPKQLAQLVQAAKAPAVPAPRKAPTVPPNAPIPGKGEPSRPRPPSTAEAFARVPNVPVPNVPVPQRTTRPTAPRPVDADRRAGESAKATDPREASSPRAVEAAAPRPLSSTRTAAARSTFESSRSQLVARGGEAPLAEPPRVPPIALPLPSGSLPHAPVIVEAADDVDLDAPTIGNSELSPSAMPVARPGLPGPEVLDLGHIFAAGRAAEAAPFSPPSIPPAPRVVVAEPTLHEASRLRPPLARFVDRTRGVARLAAVHARALWREGRERFLALDRRLQVGIVAGAAIVLVLLVVLLIVR